MAYEKKIPVDLDCPLRLTMSLIESKWKSCILDKLRSGEAMRPNASESWQRNYQYDSPMKQMRRNEERRRMGVSALNINLTELPLNKAKP